MTIQTVESQQFAQRARRIRAQASTVLTRCGLLPRFKRWRLTQDPESGMIVLFGVLNNQYIAAHTSVRFAAYSDPRVLHELADELQVQVVTCNNSDGVRYAFILEPGQLASLPTDVEFPYIEKGRLLVDEFNERIAGYEADQQKIKAGVLPSK